MYKFAKTMRNIRLFAYIAIISFQIQTVIGVGTEMVTGKVSEVTLYRGFSLIWSLVALFSIKAMHEMWEALDDVSRDIRALKEKGHLQKIDDPMGAIREMPLGSISFGPMTQKEMSEKVGLIHKILEKKDRNEPIN